MDYRKQVFEVGEIRRDRPASDFSFERDEIAGRYLRAIRAYVRDEAGVPAPCSHG